MITVFFYLLSTGTFKTPPKVIESIGSHPTAACSIENATIGASEIVVGFESGKINVFRPPFNVSTPSSYEIAVTGNIISLEYGLLNDDSLPDLLAVTQNPNASHIFYRDAGLYPDSPSRSLDLSFLPLASAVGDLDGDGLHDIAISSNDPKAIVKLYFQQDTAPRWRELKNHTFATVGNAASIAVADFDLDGRNDLCVSSSVAGDNSPVAVYFGVPSTQLSASDHTAFLASSFMPVGFALGCFYGSAQQMLVLDGSSQSADVYSMANGTIGFSFETDVAPVAMAVGRLNNDSHDDFVVLHANGNMTVYFGAEQRDDLSASPSNRTHISGNVTGVILHDLDGDGIDDLIVSTEAEGVKVFLNRWPGEVIPDSPDAVVGSSGKKYASPRAADLNRDGLPDLVVGDVSTPSIEIFYQNETEFFSDTHDERLTTNGIRPTDIVIGDFNGDGYLDIACSDDAQVSIRIYAQQAGGTFSLHRSIQCWSGISALVAADFTDDGRTDLLAVMADSSAAALYLQRDTGIDIEPSETLLLSAGSSSALQGDFDDDGRNDIFVLSSGSRAVSVWRQLNQPPAVSIDPVIHGTEGRPTLLSVEVEDGASERGSHVINWYFGDGSWNVTTGVYSINHTYHDDGNYTVLVNVTDGEFNVSVSAQAEIADFVPQIDLTVSPENPVEGQEVTLEARVEHWDPIVDYEWEINGVVDPEIVSNKTSYRFMSEGNHTVKVTVWDTDSSNYTMITVYVAPYVWPIADFETDPAALWEGESFRLVDNSSSYYTIVNWEWYVENKSTGMFDEYSGQSSVELVLDDGTYEIRLRVTDIMGNISWENRSISVGALPPSVEVTYAPSKDIFEHDLVTITAIIHSYDDIDSCALLNHSVTVPPDLKRVGDYWVANFTVSFTFPGDYELFVWTIDSDGDIDETPVHLTVFDRVIPEETDFDEIISFQRNATDSSVVTFDASALPAMFPDIYEVVSWGWGDGTYTNDTWIAEKDFRDDRDYVVTLFVVDDEGNERTFSRTMLMRAPTISLQGYSDGIVVRSDTLLTFEVVPGSSPKIDSASWSRDSGAADEFGPDYTVLVGDWGEGDHLITVSVLDEAGNLATKDFVVVIDDTPPVIHVTIDITRSYVGRDINITAVIDEPHLLHGSVYLHYSVGGRQMPEIRMTPLGDGSTFWAIIPGPAREGILQFHVTAQDVAGNVGDSGDPVSIQIVNTLFAEIWPFASVGAIFAVIALLVLIRIEAMTAVDETFVIYEDGRLVSHQTRRLRPGMDEDVLSGMFVAVQEFIKDSFRDDTTFDLRRLDFGDKIIYVEKGKKIYLAVVMQGRRSRHLTSDMRDAVAEIESKFGQVLADWDGDIDRLRGVKEITRRLYVRGLAGLGERWFKRAA